jgi:hypothetical protein
MRGFLVLLLLSGCAAIQDEQPAEAYRGKAVVRAESAETVLVATVNPPEHGRGLFGRTWEKHSLRAHVDEKSNKARYELLEAIPYVARQPRRFSSALIDTPAGPQPVPVQTIKEAKDCGQYRSGTICTRIQYVSVDVNEDLLRAVATGRLPGTFWRAEFRDERGKKYVVQTPIAEVQGLLEAVDDQAVQVRVYTPRPGSSAPRQDGRDDPGNGDHN